MLHDDITADIAVTAGFLVEGLNHSGIDKTYEAWGQGHLELIQEVVQYSELIAVMCEVAADEVDRNFPGVFEYEVVSPIGMWFGQYIQEFKKAPTTTEVCRELHKMMLGFFGKACSREEYETLDRELATNRYTVGDYVWQI